MAVEQRSLPLRAMFNLGIALFSISFAPIFIRFSETELGANGTVLYRLLIYFSVFGLGRFIAGRFAATSAPQTEQDPISQKQWLLLVSVGVLSSISLGLWALSLVYTTVAKSMLLNNLTPLFTCLGGWLLLGQRFNGKFVAGLAIALLGALTLGLEDLQSTEGLLAGDIFALLSAIFLGSYFLVVEQLRCRFSATTILLWRCAIGAVALFPVVLLTESTIFPTTPTAILAVLGLGIICEGLGQRLIADSMDKMSSSFVALFLLLEPIISTVLARFIFGEQISPITGFGFIFILSGIILAWPMNQRQQEPPRPLSPPQISRISNPKYGSLNPRTALFFDNGQSETQTPSFAPINISGDTL